jgi:hypothetical protein
VFALDLMSTYEEHTKIKSLYWIDIFISVFK